MRRIKFCCAYWTILTIGFLIGLGGCEEQEEMPDYLWTKERFTEVLTEMQIAESMLRLGIHKKRDSIVLRDSIYSSLFRKLNISRADFDSNYTYYLRRPDELGKIYDQVLVNLSEQSASLKREKKANTINIIKKE